MTKEETIEMTNEEYKKEIMKVQENLLNYMEEKYMLRFWLSYLKEQERIYSEPYLLTNNYS